MSKTYEYGGVRVGNELHAFIPAESTIRPLRHQIVVEPLAWEPSKILEVVYHGKTLRGRVLAVGPGTWPKKYDGPKGRRTKMWDSKCFRPTELKPGDLVEFGGLEIRGYLFKTVLWGHRQVVICDEDDVAIVVESEAA